MLEDKISYYQENGEALKNTPAQYKGEFEWLTEVDSNALCNEQMHLQSAFNNFFKNKKFGFPKFKSKHNSKKSFCFSMTNENIKIDYDNNMLSIPKFIKLKSGDNRLKCGCSSIGRASDCGSDG